MVAIGLTSLPEEPDAAAEAAEEGVTADAVDAGVALAGQFLAAKRALCSEALRYVRGTIERVERGDSKAALRGGLRKKAAKGVRQKSARKQGAARAAAAPARGFGS